MQKVWGKREHFAPIQKMLLESHSPIVLTFETTPEK